MGTGSHNGKRDQFPFGDDGLADEIMRRTGHFWIGRQEIERIRVTAVRPDDHICNNRAQRYDEWMVGYEVWVRISLGTNLFQNLIKSVISSRVTIEDKNASRMCEVIGIVGSSFSTSRRNIF